MDEWRMTLFPVNVAGSLAALCAAAGDVRCSGRRGQHLDREPGPLDAGDGGAS